MLGSVDGSKVDIQTSFAVPFDYRDDGKTMILDFDYAEKMLKFQRKVNPQEGLIGLYKSGNEIDKDTITLWYAFMNRLMKDPKNKGLMPQPLLLLIDPTMNDNKLSMQVRDPTFRCKVPLYLRSFHFQRAEIYF